MDNDNAADFTKLIADSSEKMQQFWQHVGQQFLTNPNYLLQSQLDYWQDYLTLCQQFAEKWLNENQTETETSSKHPDKRFQHADWQNNPYFEFLQQFYLLNSQHIQNFIQETTQETDDKTAKQVRFFTKQVLDAVSPTNNPLTNPEVLRNIVESRGENLLKGYEEFLQDFSQNPHLPLIKMTDLDAFQIGKNLAVTPGQVIFQNDLMQLIMYQPTTEQVHQTPLLIIPPWINKYYILDLRPENSLVKWLVDQGHTVFIISWINPNKRLAHKQFSDYLLEGPLAALKVLEYHLGKQKINLLGYCIGGTLLGCLLGYLSKHKEHQVASATFLTTLLDFSEPGDLGVFIDEVQLSKLEDHMAKRGYMEGQLMAAAFNSLRANELVWHYFVNNYLKGKKPQAFDLLYWNADTTNIAAKVQSFYLRNMYLLNRLIKPDSLTLADTPIDLSKITIPAYFLAAKEDHIVPWKSSFAGMQHLQGLLRFVLTSSGHVAGVVNPAETSKYNYWTNEQTRISPKKWFDEAQQHAGSWWKDWIQWLNQQAGPMVPALWPEKLGLPIIEAAPGSYVKQKTNHEEEPIPDEYSQRLMDIFKTQMETVLQKLHVDPAESRKSATLKNSQNTA